MKLRVNILRNHFFKRIGLILVASYLGLVGYLYIFQSKYIYFPDDQDFASCADFLESEKLDLAGTRAYYRNISNKIIVFYHGNAGSACDRDLFKDWFERLGYSYLFVEYSGYAGDDKKPSQKLLMADVENANNFLLTREFSRVVIAGESLGSALAAYHSSLYREDQLLLFAPFEKLASVAQKHLPYVPASLVLRESYESANWVHDVKSAMIIHGSKDTTIPSDLGRQLYEQIASDDKTFVLIPNAGHNDLYEFPETYKNVADYLKASG